MEICNYCGGAIKLDIELCPHCGGQLNQEKVAEVKIQNIKAFSMKGRYVASHTLLRNFILFIIVPFFCAPFGITLLWAILVGSTGQGKPSTALILIYAFVLLLSVPGSIILMLNNYRRKADQTRCLVTENSIDCVTASGRKLTIATKAIMKIEAKESRLQKKYGLGDIWLVCTPGDMAHTIILNDIDDFTNSYTMLKSALGTK